MTFFKSSSHHQVWRLAWPMILTNISVPLLGSIDTAILGHLDSALFLGAVAVGSSILTLILWAFGFLRMGTTSLVAQAVGKNDFNASSHLLLQSSILALALSLLLFCLQQPLFSLALDFFKASDSITALATSYCQIRIYSAPATLINFALIGWFIGRQNTRAPLIIVVSQNLLNILLDFYLIIGLEMSIDGAALATVIAEYCGLALAILLAWRTVRPESFKLNPQQLYRLHNYTALLQVNWHLFVRTASLLFTFAFFTAQGARQGDDILAANALLFQLLLLVSYALDGFAHAAEAMVGKAVGAKNIREIQNACKATSIWAGITAVLLSIFFALGQGFLLSLFTDIQHVIDIAEDYYFWIIILPLAGVWGYQLDGIFIGAGQTKSMKYTMLLAVFTVFLPIFWIFNERGNWGLWFALSCFMFSRGVFLGLVLIRIQRKKLWF